MYQSRQLQENINFSNKQRLSTPSLLFCKSSPKLARQSISNMPLQPLNMFSDSKASKSPQAQSEFLENRSYSCQCANHPEKCANYVEENDDKSIYFCQKCAIALASTGHIVNKIPSKGPSKQMSGKKIKSKALIQDSFQDERKLPHYDRSSQIKSFLKNLKILEGNLATKHQQMKEQLIESEQFYGGQLQQINDYFTYVQQSLQLQKNKCYHHILQQRKKREQPVRQICVNLDNLYREMELITTDLQENSKVVYTIEDDYYHTVMAQYVQRFDRVHQEIEFIMQKNTAVERRRIQFEGVPQSISFLSEAILQNYNLAYQDESNGTLGTLGKASPIQKNRQNNFSLNESIEQLIAQTSRRIITDSFREKSEGQIEDGFAICSISAVEKEGRRQYGVESLLDEDQ